MFIHQCVDERQVDQVEHFAALEAGVIRENLRSLVQRRQRHDGGAMRERAANGADHPVQTAGATVLRGLAGFGAHSRIHTAKVLRLSEDLPMVIEIVDRPDRIMAFLPELDRMMDEGLVTLEKVRVIVYRHSETKNPRESS